MRQVLVRSFGAACVGVLSACATVPVEDASPFPRRTDDPCFEAYVDESKVLAEFEASADCCTSIENFDFKKLIHKPAELSQPSLQEAGHVIAVSGKTPVFNFPTGRSRFVARDISTFSRAPRQATILLRSAGLTTLARQCTDVKVSADGKTFGEYRYFIPVMTFLDIDKRPLASAVAGAPILVDGRPALNYLIPVGTTFVVVYSDAASYGRAVRAEGEKKWELSYVPGKTPLLFPVYKDNSISGVGTTSGIVHIYFH